MTIGQIIVFISHHDYFYHHYFYRYDYYLSYHNLIYHNLRNVISLDNSNLIIDVARIIDYNYYTRYNYISKYHEIYIEYYVNKTEPEYKDTD